MTNLAFQNAALRACLLRLAGIPSVLQTASSALSRFCKLATERPKNRLEDRFGPRHQPQAQNGRPRASSIDKKAFPNFQAWGCETLQCARRRRRAAWIFEI